MEKKMTLEKIETLKELTLQGKSRPYIAKQLGVAKMTVYRYQRELGLI